MRSRSRDVRSTRREVYTAKRQHEALESLIDTSEELGLYDEPLPNGTKVDPRQAWVLPSNEQEK